MRIKDLFGKGKSYKVLSAVDPDTIGLDAESYRNIQAKTVAKDRFIPNVDFSTASNFVHYGSAKKYYETSFDRIVDEYPYDGSAAEKQEFFNSSSYLDLHIFENEYPTTTGYATLGTFAGLGTLTQDGSGLKQATQFQRTTVAGREYITIMGGPHTASNGMEDKTIHSQFSASNIYDSDIYDTEGVLSLGKQGTRESNLKFDLSRGVTTEFWINVNSDWPQSNTNIATKQVIFDLWNGQASSSHGYGRLLIYLTGAYTELGVDPIRAHIASGSTVWDLRYGAPSATVTGSLTDTWNHLAFTFFSGSTSLESSFYLNGDLKETHTTTTSSATSADITSFGVVENSLNAYIGALRQAPSGNAFRDEYEGGFLIGGSPLSASLDEFRYWKIKRTH